MRSSTIHSIAQCKMLAWLLGLPTLAIVISSLGTTVHGKLTVTCRDFWRTTSDNSPYVKAIEDGSLLQEEWTNSDAKILALNVINGTLWLNLGGSLNQFEPVIGTPPSSSSQATLKQTLEQAKESWRPRGVVVNYLPPSLFDCDHLTPYTKDLPIWVSQSSGVHGCNLGLNHVIDKNFALDAPIERLLQEDILLKNDRVRVLDILNNFFLDKVLESEVRYLKTRYARQKEDTRESFTDLFLQNLIHLVERKTGGPKGGPKKALAFLPDLRETDAVYVAQDFQSIRDSLQSSPNECHLVSLRAGILESGESIAVVQKVLEEFDNIIILAFAKPYDLTTGPELQQIQQMLGRDRVLIQAAHLDDLGFPKLSPNPQSAGSPAFNTVAILSSWPLVALVIIHSLLL